MKKQFQYSKNRTNINQFNILEQNYYKEPYFNK